MKLINVEIEGVDIKDHPDYSDAFIAYAEREDGTPLTDQELDEIDGSDVYEYVMDALY